MFQQKPEEAGDTAALQAADVYAGGSVQGTTEGGGNTHGCQDVRRPGTSLPWRGGQPVTPAALPA